MKNDYNKYLSKKYTLLRKSSVANSIYCFYRMVKYHNQFFISKKEITRKINNFGISVSSKLLGDIRKEFNKWGVSPDDYLAYGFYRLTKTERRKYIVETPYSMYYDWAFFNDINYSKFFFRKTDFCRDF